MPAVEELPSTIKRSPKKAQNTWIKAHDSAVKEYGEGRRAHMTAFAALKHSFEKVGDHWEAKDGKGPSDKGATDRSGRTAGGVDANASKDHLQQVAAKLGVTGRSKMTKQELVTAIQKANKTATAKSRPSAKSNGAKSNGAKSSTTKSSTTKSGTTKSGTTKSGTTKSGSTKSSSTKSGTTKSGTKSSTRAATSSRTGSRTTAKVNSGPKSTTSKTKSGPKSTSKTKSTSTKKSTKAKSR
uniref:DNA topoisomerase I n=1 Tax=Nonomuraea gerenzanensis TaxID=93944 RepID=A0A1M4EN94_9ACTN|nr:DNA topoisomerase I [Nonomuraea gerenzanensis]